MTVASLGWQEIAQALSTRAGKDNRRSATKHRGKRVISQETVRRIREDAALEGAHKMSRSAIAAKYKVSPHYVYLVTECGLRDDEREKLR